MVATGKMVTLNGNIVQDLTLSSQAHQSPYVRSSAELQEDFTIIKILWVCSLTLT